MLAWRRGQMFPLPTHRFHIARRASLWMVGPVVLAMRGPAVELTPPPHCTGAIDLLGIAIARRWPELPAGQLVGTLQIIAVIVSLGCFAELAVRTTNDTVVAIATTSALGVSQLFQVMLALPWEAAAFAACASTVLASQGILDGRSRSWLAAGGAFAAVLLAASIVPAWTAACVVCTFAVLWQRLTGMPRPLRATTAAIVAVAGCAVPLTILRATQPVALDRGMSWSACVLPAGAIAARASESARVLAAIGPVVLALSALGIGVAILDTGAKRAVFVAVLVALAMVPAAPGAWRPAAVMAPVLLAIWWLAAIGLRDVVRLIGTGPNAILGVTTAALLLPLLQWTMVRAQERDDFIRPLTHERASLREVRSSLNVLPPGSRLVEEDASVDLLLRAALINRRGTNRVTVIPSTRADVLAALQTSRVYAFPSAQRDLNVRGFVIESLADPRRPDKQLRGLARVTGTRPCAELGRTWVDLAGVGASGRVALSAASELAEGPVVVYFSGATAYTPGPDGWPPRAQRGFDLRMFGRRTAEESARLDAEAKEAGLQGHPVFASPFVARLTLYRTPHAPLALPIVLGPPRARGVGRLVADYAGALPLTICDTPNTQIATF